MRYIYTSYENSAHLEKLCEFCVVKMLLPIMPKMQSNKFTVPVKRDMMMNNSLPENFFDIFLKGKTKINKLCSE